MEPKEGKAGQQMVIKESRGYELAIGRSRTGKTGRIGSGGLVLGLWLLLSVMSSNGFAENLLAVASNGRARIIDLELDDSVLSGETKLRFASGLLFSTRYLGGGVAVGGKHYVAAVENRNFDSNDVSLGWKLYTIDLETLVVAEAADLGHAITAMAVGPGDGVFAVTFMPARFVKVDLVTGALQDLGAFDIDQSTVNAYQLDNGSVLWDAESNSFLYAHNNHQGDFGLWRIAANGGSYSVIEDAVFAGFRPTNLMLIHGALHALYYNFVYRLDLSQSVVTATYQKAISRNGYFGPIQFVGKALLPTNGGLACEPSSQVLCLADGAFAVSMSWTDPNDGQVKPAFNQKLSQDSGALWFTAPSNLEVLVKVLDACGLNQHRWFFGAASTDLAFEITVRETATGTVRTYSNTPSTPALAITDTSAFSCSG